MQSTHGTTLLEILIVIVIGSLIVAVLLPRLGALRASAVTAAGARHLAITLQATRWKSVTLARSHGLRFFRDGEGWAWNEVRDGNGNGIRTAEIASGVDPMLPGTHRLADAVAGIDFGFPPGGPYPKPPPATEWLSAESDPVGLGQTDLVAFGPLGTGTSGTIYLTDGWRELYAVVLYGRTGRVRVLRYVAAREAWSW